MTRKHISAKSASSPPVSVTSTSIFLDDIVPFLGDFSLFFTFFKVFFGRGNFIFFKREVAFC